MPEPSPMFAGPVHRIDMTKSEYSFYVLQGTSTLQLDYESKEIAIANRQTLCEAKHSYQIGSNKLLQAIQTAISDAKAALSQQGQDSDG